jgi:hypothetical protein
VNENDRGAYLVMFIRSVHRLLRGIYRGSRRTWIARRLRRLWWGVRMRANQGVCSVEIANVGAGFFAQMNWCLYLLEHCRRHNLIPDIRLTGDSYRDPNRGANWLDYYFEILRPKSSQQLATSIRYTKKAIEWEDMGQPIESLMSLEDGARTLHRYLRPKPHILKMVDDFWQTLDSEGSVVGVRFRGTDKSSEAPRVSWNYCLNVLKQYLGEHDEIRSIFVASDEQKFVDFIKASVTKVPVHARDDHYRSRDSGEPPVFLGTGGGYEKGEDALVNALLLSRCSVLIRTSSFLSAWASILNPKLKVILLNKPYDDKLWYPEREILRGCGTKYLPENHAWNEAVTG